MMDSLAAGIQSMATPHRTDRLYPGDVYQFDGQGLGIAYGAAGVLYALHSAGYPTREEHIEWLLARVREQGDHRIGLYDGLYGTAWVLDRMGLRDQARDVLDRAHRHASDTANPDLETGLSGMALTLLHFAQVDNDRVLAEKAEKTAQQVVRSGRPKVPGLMRGATGRALLFIRMYEQTGAAGWLDHARDALLADLATGKIEDGVLVLPDDVNRVSVYLHSGTTGTALVAREFVKYREDAEIMATIGHGDDGCRPEFFYAPGLMEGRAGIIMYLAARRNDPASPTPQILEAQLRLLHWHALQYQGNLVFPGRLLYRLSADLATGTAGVLLSVSAATQSTPGLPFLELPGKIPGATVPSPTAGTAAREERVIT
ncbi:MAG: hypothetical protein ACRDN0_20660 [Trebonia sp.]